MNKLEILRRRAEKLSQVRSYFASQNVTEVDCPALSACASVDLYIDLMPVHLGPEHIRYLHSSPEYGMKRLLSQGMGDIYQLSHVFRHDERSKRHTPEFTLIEWYRLNFTFDQMIADTVALLQLFVGPASTHSITYRQAFQTISIDPATASQDDLLAALHAHHIAPHDVQERDDLLNLLLACCIEPTFPKDKITILTHYPSSQAALARTLIDDGYAVAERFECYYGGLELANGYHELADPIEQHKRFVDANSARIAYGKVPLPIDHRFINALHTLPDCCGVAVGFDRLLQLHLGLSNVDDVLPFVWEEA
jgi:lysyl-tRNA synthetase class 2